MTKENGTRSLNGIAACEFETFSRDARLALGDVERISSLVAFRAPTKTPAKTTPSTTLPRRAIPGPFQLPKKASQAMTLSHETEGSPTIKTTTPDTTGAVLGRPRYLCLRDTLIMMSGMDKDSF